MSENISEESRSAIKASLGIHKTNSKNNCRSCHYHPVDDICNKHYIKTDVKETCEYFKKDIKFKFISGGRMSPR
ncbi:MAG TPA: hypothetical protein VEY70_07015 [Metabacillus sp.]|nr:hypothetical protein [Metabacillus sp.]